MDSSTPLEGGSHPDRIHPSEPPESVVKAISLIWWSVGISIVSLVLSLILMDDLVERAIDNRFLPRRGEVNPGDIRTEIYWDLGINFALAVVIAAFFTYYLEKGADWSRFIFTAVSLGGMALTLLGWKASADPLPLMGVKICVSMLLLWAIVLLFRPDSQSFFTAAD